MNWIKLFVVLLLAVPLSGCFLTKVVSVPMRAVGAVISIVPVAGNTAHDAIDGAADVVDDVPI
jgi:hypothetical protein